MSDLLQKLLAEKPWVLLDGATGTSFFAMGLEHGDAPELWNLAQPEKVKQHYQSFVDAGSDLILTNTFGGTRNRLRLHQVDDQVYEINKRAAELAREVVAKAGRPVVVAGSMGPTGDLFEPLGPLTHEEGVKAFAEQAKGLKDGGCDLLWIETISSVEELRAAAEGALTTGLPYVCTLSFDTNGRTMMGIAPAELPGIIKTLPAPPIAYGANCGVGAAELAATVFALKQAAPEGDLLVAKSNCGVPKYHDGEILYTGTPHLMADYARLLRDLGVRLIGGCCGNSAEHIAAMHEALESHVPGDTIPDMDAIQARLGEISKGALKESSGQPLGERPGRENRRRGRSRGAEA